MTKEDAPSKERGIEKKTSDAKPEALDLWISQSIFPDAAGIFSWQPRSLDEVISTANIVLDTNALLLPYSTGSQTLLQIEKTYQKLLGEHRLWIPAQVAREFAKNRTIKLGELFQRLAQKRAKLPTFQQGRYPMLDNVVGYPQVREFERQLDELIVKYRDSISSLIDQVKNWEWNDPISLLYRSVFPPEVIVETNRPQDEIQLELLRRFSHKIPPGYKDSNKPDQGIGDLLIWFTILEIGSRRNESLIFVTGEEKADWWQRSEGEALYPRFELVDEYRRASMGRSFHIIKHSRLLELLGASNEAIADVKHQEEIMAVAISPQGTPASTKFNTNLAVISVGIWLLDKGYRMTASDSKFYSYLAETNDEVRAIEVIHVRSPRIAKIKLENRDKIYRKQKLGFPVTVVAVVDDPAHIPLVERAWVRLDPPFRLCIGTLDPTGQFIPHRPL